VRYDFADFFELNNFPSSGVTRILIVPLFEPHPSGAANATLFEVIFMRAKGP
jgi:hypothetical protein